MAKQCEMVIGFLIPHPCPNQAVAACTRCNLLFCEEHLNLTPGGLVCSACQQGLDQPVAVAPVAREFDQSDLARFSSLSAFDSDDDMFSDLS